jgi:hypothetical protein
MPNTVLVAASAVLAVAWIPVGLYFYRSWKKRKSPLSLAICGLIALPIYTNSMTGLFLEAESKWFCSIMFFVSLLLFANFIFCFYWQRRSFSGGRELKERRGKKPHQSST